MHPNAAFRSNDRDLLADIVRQLGFGSIYATTPDGPRVAHTAFFLSDDGALQFHLARGNALTRYLAGMQGLAVVQGPDAYVSPDWYAAEGQVPTWNYVAIEMEGPVRAMDRDGLVGLLDDLSTVNEAQLAPKAPWTRDKMDRVTFDRMCDAIVGFEMEVLAWRPTLKLSQNKDVAERERVATQLDMKGHRAIASLMRGLVGNGE